MKEIFVRFGSHRARDYALGALTRKPQSFYSWTRNTFHGVYKVTTNEAAKMRASSSHARFTVLRGPYTDLRECIKWA